MGPLNTMGSREEKYRGGALPSAQGEQEKAKEAGQQAGQGMLDGFLSGLQDAARLAGEALVTGDWAAAKQALAQAVGNTLKGIINSVAGGLGPIGGLIGSFAGGVIDGLIKKFFKKPETPQHVVVDNVVRTLPANLNADLAAAPGSRLASGRAFATGASYASPAAGTVTIKVAAGLDKLIDVAVSNNLRLQMVGV